MATRNPVERVLIGLAVVACMCTGVILAFTRSETHFVALAATGRLHEQCGWRASLDAALYEKARMAARLDVARRSRLVERDGPLSLYQSPYGRAWVQSAQTDAWAALWAGDLHHWPPRWA